MSIPEALPQAYPPTHTIREVTAWSIHLLNNYKPALRIDDPTRAERRPVADLDLRTLLRESVPERVHRRQFEAWCTAKANPHDRDLSFAGACKRHGWPEKSAERNVDRVLTALVLALNRGTEGHTRRSLDCP